MKSYTLSNLNLNIQCQYLFSILLLCVIALVVFVLVGTRFSRTAELLNKFPGPSFLSGLWILASICLGSIDDVIPKIGEAFNKYGRCIRIWIFHAPTLVVANHKVVERILSSPEHTAKPGYYDVIRSYIGDGLLTAPVGKWKRDRKQLNAGVNFKMFDFFLNTFNKYSQIVVENCAEKSAQNSGYQTYSECFLKCTLGIVGEAAIGMRDDDYELSDSRVLKAVSTAVEGVRLRIVRYYVNIPGLWHLFGNWKSEKQNFDPFFVNMIHFIQKRRAERHLEFHENADFESSTRTFMDILLDPAIPRDDSDIRSHLVTMLVGGTDTAATALNYTLYLLALNPSHQKKVHEELDDVFVKRSDNFVTFADLANLKYLEMCIKESMRIYSPVPIIARVAQKDIPLGDNLGTIPKGCTMAIFIYELHRDKAVFPQPETFIPERFTPEASATRSPYAYIPFSAGVRNCIGQKYAMMEMKVILSHLLRKFVVTTTVPQKHLKLRYGIFLEPIGGIPLKLTPRVSKTM